MPKSFSCGILSPVIRMNNFPVYLSQWGTATLILREIPYKKTAYILLRTVLEEQVELLIQDCAAFCRNCGAENCFVAAAESETVIPGTPAYALQRMTAEKAALPLLENPFRLEPLCPDNEDLYISLYNRCFRTVSNAATYDRKELQRVYRMAQQGFLAYLEDTPCGMGELHENELAAVGLLPEYRGMGKYLTLALLERCPGPELSLTVVSDNYRALALYEKLGFRTESIVSRWYRC